MCFHFSTYVSVSYDQMNIAKYVFFGESIGVLFAKVWTNNILHFLHIKRWFFLEKESICIAGLLCYLGCIDSFNSVVATLHLHTLNFSSFMLFWLCRNLLFECVLWFCFIHSLSLSVKTNRGWICGLCVVIYALYGVFNYVLTLLLPYLWYTIDFCCNSDMVSQVCSCNDAAKCTGFLLKKWVS